MFAEDKIKNSTVANSQFIRSKATGLIVVKRCRFEPCLLWILVYVPSTVYYINLLPIISIRFLQGDGGGRLNFTKKKMYQKLFNRKIIPNVG